ncbi:hypothetical protein VTK56DRAFT_7213 [Thermocarpiscus australiensis]
MDLSKLIEPRSSEAKPQESDLRELVEEAGLREENWKRREDVVWVELYECPYNDLYKRILKEFIQEYKSIIQEWATSHNLRILSINAKAPSLLKKGSISTSSGQLAVFIPFPLRCCAVQYQPREHDATTRQPIDWLSPVLLPENSALILVSGEIRFLLIVISVEGV